jgi:hypothetical protein
MRLKRNNQAKYFNNWDLVDPIPEPFSYAQNKEEVNTSS